MKNDKTKRVLTSLLMGMNCVNGFAPLAATLPATEAPKPVTKTKAMDEQIEYTPVNYQSLVDSVDKAVFGTAEAAFTENVVGTVVNGETITVSGAVSVQNVSVSGFSNSGTVSSGGTQNVSSGGGVSKNDVGGGGVQNISNGGIAEVNSFGSGAVQNVLSGGFGRVNIISNGAVQNISSGGLTSGNLVHTGGIVYVQSGAVAASMTNDGGYVVNRGRTSSEDQNNTIKNGGIEDVLDNGLTYRTVLSGGTMNMIGSNTSAYAVFAYKDGVFNMTSGKTRQVKVYDGGYYNMSGGFTDNVAIYAGGTMLQSGGSTSNVFAENGGYAHVSGGTILTGRASSGGLIEVVGELGTARFDNAGAYGGSIVYAFNGQGSVVSAISGGSVIIKDGGTVSKFDVRSDGTFLVSSGGYMSVGTVGKSATDSTAVQIIDGGTASNTSVLFGTQIVSNGTANSNTIKSAGTQIVSGGTAIKNTVTNSAAVQKVVGGTALNNSFAQGASQKVSGGSAVSNTFYSETSQTIDGSGYVVSNFLNSGALQTVIGGSTEFTAVAAGASQIVKGGSAKINNISAGATQIVSGGIVTSNSIAGAQIVLSGQATSNDILPGGKQDISGGTATGNTLASGAIQNVSGGTATSNTLASGAIQNISGGTAMSNTLASGAIQNVSGGTALNNIISAGGLENIFAGGTAIEDNDQNLEGTINVGSGAVEIINGSQNIAAGGGVTVAAGGTQVVNGEVSPGAGSLIIGGTQLINPGGTATNPTLTSGAEQIVQGGTALDTEVVGGATQTINSGKAENTIVDSNGIQILNGGSALNTTINSGGIQKAYSGTLGGGTISGGITEIYSPSVVVDNVTMTDGLIRLGADGGNYNFTGVFDFQGGLVDMTQNPDGHMPNPGTYETLTIDNLKGNDGIFKMDIDLNSAVYGSETTYGDKIVITNGTPGTHYIQVLDKSLFTGTEIIGDRKLLLVTDLAGVHNLNYVGKDLNNGGVWHTLPPILFKEGNKWYLGYIQKEASDDATTYLSDRQVAVYNQWTRIANDSLRKRLGDLRYNEADAGVWARYYNGKLTGNNFDQHYHTYQVGIDKKLGSAAYGLALEKQEANQTYGYGRGEGSTTAGNIYYTKYSDTGSYFDAIFKYGKINSKYNTLGTFPDHADYDTSAYSLSLEYGRTNRYKAGYFVEPKVQLTYGHISAENYITNRGTLVEESAIKSLIGRVGFVAGRKLKDSDYYFKAGLFREFKGERDVHLGAANGENMYKSENYGDSWFELGIGGNVKLAKKTHLYGDIEKSFGADIQKTWQINAGVRWEF